MNSGNIINFIKVDSEEGKKYVTDIENILATLRKEKNLNITEKNAEKFRFHKHIFDLQESQTQEEQKNQQPQEKENQENEKIVKIVTSFLTEEDMKGYRLEKVTVSQYGRKAGTTLPSPPHGTLRFIIHLGPTEVYYLTAESFKDRPLILNSGQGIIVSTLIEHTGEVKVYPDPIRILNDKRLQALLPKIRPKDYMRYTLTLDYTLLPSTQEEGEVSDTNDTNGQETQKEE